MFYNEDQYQIPNVFSTTEINLSFLIFTIKSKRGWVFSCLCRIACACMWEVSFMFSPLVIWQCNYMYLFDSIEPSTIYTKTLPPLIGQRICCFMTVETELLYYLQMPTCPFWFWCIFLIYLHEGSTHLHLYRPVDVCICCLRYECY